MRHAEVHVRQGGPIGSCAFNARVVECQDLAALRALVNRRLGVAAGRSRHGDGILNRLGMPYTRPKIDTALRSFPSTSQCHMQPQAVQRQ